MSNEKFVAELRAELTAMRADAPFLKHWQGMQDRRAAARREVCALIENFRGGSVPLEELRKVFDTRTRKEWDIFGLKGLSGAMFLNMLVKHLAEARDEVARRLRELLRAPTDDDDARRRMRSFLDFLRGLPKNESGAAIQSGRLPYFTSALWNVQAPGDWVVIYPAFRDRFEAAGVLPSHEDPVERYFAFIRVMRELAAALGLTLIDLECLLEWHKKRDELPAAAADGAPPPTTGPPPSLAESRRYWLLSPGPDASAFPDFVARQIAGIGWGDLGNLGRFASVENIKDVMRKSRGENAGEPKHDALACWEFAHVMRPGDVVFAKKGRKSIVGRGVVKSDYQYDAKGGDYPHRRDVEWQWTGDVVARDKLLVTKTLTDISGYPVLLAQLQRATGGETELPDAVGPVDAGLQPYTLDDACEELFLPRSELELLVGLARHRRNLIIQGPPGVGKTFVASRLADLLVERRDPENVMFVQFHPSYAYEDFVQGWRPRDGSGGYELRDGPFLEICDKALQDKDDTYVLVIDEINRGNLGKVFGELMMLIEADKREPRWGVRLQYAPASSPPFHVPPNLILVGTMNTADRSLAVVDYALRRRFAFATVEPQFEEEAFASYLRGLGAAPKLIERIRGRLERVNAIIGKDESLGAGFLIGHSYFCSRPSEGSYDEEWVQRIVEYELGPLLQEYWFDRGERAREALEILRAEG